MPEWLDDTINQWNYTLCDNRWDDSYRTRGKLYLLAVSNVQGILDAMPALFLVIFLLFTLGLAIGSFLNVVIYRMVHHDSALRGRSYCDTCKKQIIWYDNIPLVSFLLLKRKCRFCGAPIPWEYPTVELLTGILFV